MFESPPFFSATSSGPVGHDVKFALQLANALGVDSEIQRDALGVVFHRDAAQFQQITNIFIANQPTKPTADGLLETYKDILEI